MVDLKQETETLIAHLKRGGIILYPTDTVWGLGCDSTNADAIEKLLRIKKSDAKKSMLCLVNDFKMLQQFVEEVPEVAYDILKFAKKPTTIIYDNPIRVSEALIADDNTLGIRVARDPFVGKLIKKFRRPIVSTSANFSGKPAPAKFSEIDPELIKLVDYVCKVESNSKYKKPSAIIKIGMDSTVKVIRN